jgi:hypothetical protein
VERRRRAEIFARGMYRESVSDDLWPRSFFVFYMTMHDATGRFERMIIALSTHALFANTSESVHSIASDPSAAIVRACKTSYFGYLT